MWGVVVVCSMPDALCLGALVPEAGYQDQFLEWLFIHMINT